MHEIIVNAEKMFDGYSIKRKVSILIKNGVILKIGKYGEFKGKTLNAKFISPGLIDMHIHLTTYAGLYLKSMTLIDYLNKMLIYNGVTTVRDLGNPINHIYNLKNYEGIKPRIFSSIFLDGNKPLWGMSFIIKNKEQVQELLKNYSFGIQWVKAYKSINPEILKIIIKEAHSRGLKVAGDLLDTSQEDAIAMGIDTLEHALLLINGSNGHIYKSTEETYREWAKIDPNSETFEVLINKLKRNKTVICPTLILSQMELFPSHEYSKHLNVLFPLNKNYKNNKIKSRFTKININLRKKAFKNILCMIKKMNESGVTIVSGSDSGNPHVAPGFSLHQELKLMVKAGLTPMEALNTATGHAADTLGSSDIGYIKSGYKADIILFGFVYK